MDNPKTQLVDKLKEANNVLVTVSANPSVDQLSAAIGLTLLLSKLNKHATAVFSGHVPSTLEFLKPEDTIEATTDSLRDFIIALDKSKADKLRYKVEDKMVKIFITPYRTSIGQDDLEFSQGDFNVDVVVALGVHSKEDVDQAITAHGRILHDATVATVNTQSGSELGSINWSDQQSSSLCEMVVALADLLKANSLDGQMATALLTGIVAETERFSNAKTTSTTMQASAKLMAAGANQQLVATKLEEGEELPPEEKPPSQPEGGGDVSQPPEEGSAGADGALRINHADEKPPAPPPEPSPESEPEPEPEPEKPVEQIRIDDQGQLQPLTPPGAPSSILPPPVDEPHIRQDHRTFLSAPAEPISSLMGEPGETHKAPDGSRLITQPPSMGGRLSAAAEPEDSYDPAMESLSLPKVEPPILSHNGPSHSASGPPPHEEPKSPPPPPVVPPPPTPPLAPPPPPPKKETEEKPDVLPRAVIDVMDDRTLNDIEQAVESPHYVAREVAKAAGDKKTLQSIEETVGSPHLEYEAHESEPPEPEVKAKAEPEGPAPSAPAADEPPADSSAASPSEPNLTIPDEPSTLPEPPKEDPAAQAALPEPSAPAADDDAQAPVPDADDARDAVAEAISAGGDGRSSLPPINALGTTDFGVPLHDDATSADATPPAFPQVPSPNIHIDSNGTLSYPQPSASGDDQQSSDNAAPASDASAPPPVPPPMMPPLPQHEP